VRAAVEADMAGIVAITNHEIAGGVAHFGLEPVSVELVREQFQREAARYPWFVATGFVAAGPLATDGPDILGFARASPWKSRGAYAWTAEIGVYVRPQAREAGVGRALYTALFPALRDAGFRTILAGIALPNPPSVRLHESFGMRAVGVFPSVGFKLGAWRDVGYWALRFGDDGPPAPL
jgi:phosphinothricin acetyltransferase